MFLSFALALTFAAPAAATQDSPTASAEESGGESAPEHSDVGGAEERLAEIQRLVEEQNELPEEISHIEGQIVPVGKRNEYYKTFPRWNIASNPLGWMKGIFGLSVSYAAHQNFALRGDANIFQGGGHELNAGMQIFFRRAYQGFFLEPGLMFRGDGDFSQAGPQVLAGWQWRWDSGLNASVALGSGRDLSGSSTGDYPFMNSSLRFGYAF